MALCSFIEKRRNRYYFRSRLPVDLVPIVGRTHVVISLGTADPPTAKFRAAFCMQSLTHSIAILRLAMRRADNIAEDRQNQVEALVLKAFDLGRRYTAEEAALQQSFLSKLREIASAVRGTPALTGLDMVFDNASRPGLDLVHAQSDVTPASAILPTAPVVQRPDSADRTEPATTDERVSWPWHRFQEEFLRDKPDLSPKTVWSYNQAFGTWKTLIGDKAIGAIRRADLKLFADHLRDRDNSRGGKLKHKTIVRSLAHIKTFVSWAIGAGLVANDGFSAVTARSMTRAEKFDGNPRRAFTNTELGDLFSSSLFLKKWPSQEDRAMRWFLLVAALTGARTEEIATAPAILVRIGDIDCLDLRDAGRKTSAAPRLIPIMPTLMRMGFRDWANAQAERGYTLVQPGPAQRTASSWSKRLNRYIHKNVADDPKLVLYSLRHNFRQMLRAANIGDELADKIFGHSSDKVGAGYGRELSPDEARLFVSSIRPPIDFFGLYTRKAA